MTPETNKETGEQQPSGLLLMLQNLETLYHCYCQLATDAARKSVLLGLTAEAGVLTLKLKAMRQRWVVYLPFQEVIDVHFEKWAEKVQSWNFGSQYEPSNGLILDLMGMAVEEPDPNNLEKSVIAYFGKVDKALRKPLSEWQEKAHDGLNDELKKLLAQPYELTEVQAIATRTFAALYNELKELYEYFSSELKEEQFRVLAIRLYHRNCQNAIKEAHNEVVRAHNAWPQKYQRDHALQMKERVKAILMKDTLGEELKEYIDLDYPELFEDACFGQFLFKNRHQLKPEDCALIVKCCTMISELNRYVDPDGSARRRAQAAFGRQLDAAERNIVKKLLAWVEVAEWRAGVTVASFTLGINRMLGVGYPLEPDMQALSNDLWQLLKKRKNCDDDKSLTVTWLNIVGWCVKKGYLSGGSPALCKQFLKRPLPDEYKAIDKGKNGEPLAFRKIEPLLERFLR